jgi:hypothetical protein
MRIRPAYLSKDVFSVFVSCLHYTAHERIFNVEAVFAYGAERRDGAGRRLLNLRFPLA